MGALQTIAALGVPGRLVGEGTPDPKWNPMKTSYPECGDPVLQPRNSSSDLESPTGLLWGIDLSRCTSKQLGKACLQESEAELRGCLDQFTSVKKVVVAFRLPEQRNVFADLKVPERRAVKLHNDLERERSRDVPFVYLDITGCQDLNLLRRRIDEVMHLPASTWSTILLDWHDAELQPIHEVMAEQVL